MRCPRCKSEHIWMHWVAMYDWDTDGWTCFDCGHTWASR